MSTMMDIIFSTVLGGVIILIVLNANIIIKETWTVYNSDVMVQNMMVETAQVVEGEFRNMGCGIDTSENTITQALDTCISFRMKIRPTNPVDDTITYYSGSTDELASTDNPLDRFLYRRMNGSYTHSVGVITQFRLRYFTKEGDSIRTPVSAGNLYYIKIIEITMEIQNPFAIYRDPTTVKAGEQKALYATSLWKQTRLASQNLKR